MRDPVSEKKLNWQNQNTQRREQRHLGLCLLSSRKGQGFSHTRSTGGNTKNQHRRLPAVPAIRGSSGSHERREQAPRLAGMIGTAEARTAGPAACCQRNWCFCWQRNTDLRIGNHSITRLPLLFLLLFSSGWFLPFIPQSRISLREGCCDAVSQLWSAYR